MTLPAGDYGPPARMVFRLADGSWGCSAAADCDEPAALQWPHWITDDDQAVIAALDPDWAGIHVGDTVPVMACATHNPAAAG